MKRGSLIALATLAGLGILVFAPLERVMPQARPLEGEACPSRTFDQIGGQQFGGYNAADLGKAVAVLPPRGEGGGISCRGFLDRLDCRVTRTGLILVRTPERSAWFDIPEGRTARVRAHRQITSCVLDPATAPPASG